MANIDSVKLPNGNEYNLQDVVTPRVEASQPNLLINPWFTVNQRGFTSGTYSSRTYTVDRWCTNKTTISLVSGGLSVAANAEGGYIRQYTEDNFSGETLTLSVMIDGVIYSQSGNGQIEFNPTPTTFIMWKPSGPYIHFENTSSTPVTVRAVKLEIGSISTLHLDTAPNYTTELLKCRRYFIRFTHAEQWKAFAMVQNISTSEAAWVLNLPVPMRAAPTFKSAGTFQLYAATPVLVSTFTATFPDLETVVVSITGSASNLTPWATSRLNNSTANAYIELDAEL